MKVSWLKRRDLLPLVFLAAVTSNGCGAFLITNEMMSNSVAGAVQLIKAGNTEATLRQFETKAREYEIERDWWKARIAYRVAGLLAESLGNYQKALIYLRKDLEITKQYLGRGREPRARGSLYLLARAYLAVNDHDNALLLVREALVKFIPDISNDTTAQLYSDLQTALGDIYRMKGDVKSALQHHEEAFRVQESLTAWALRQPGHRTGKPGLPAVSDRYLRGLTALARDHLALGEHQAATKSAENLLQKAKELGDRGWQGEARRLLGDIAYKKDDKVAALFNYQQARALAETLSMPGVSLWSHVGEARVHLAQGRAEQAAEHLERAMKIVEALRSFLQLEQLRSSFFEDKAQIYSEAVLAQLQLGREDHAFHTMERSRSRAFLDVLGTRVDLSRSRELIAAEMELRRRAAEIRLSQVSGEEGEIERQPRGKTEFAEKAYNEFLAGVRKESKEQNSLLTVEPLGLKQVQELLDPGQALLEYFVTPEKILLWIVSKNNVATLSLRTTRNELVAKINALRNQISELTPIGEYQNAAQELYGLLIQPALPYIAAAEIIIVPHDALHYLPFQALHSPQGKYLIEEYSLSYLSSASLMQFTQEKRKSKGELTSMIAQGGKLLTFGNPDLGDPKMALQFARTEVNEIKNLYPQSVIYLNKEATEEKAKALSPQNDIIHFASHAELNQNDPLSSAVLLAKSDKEDGRLEVREIFGMDLKASLVVLSACDTGLGKLSSGDELVGLTRAFIYAGTPSVVASLWKVDDSSTAHLMASFYKNLKTMTKVEALRQAQLNLIRGNVNSELLARRGIGGIGKLGETPAAQPTVKSLSQDSISVSSSVSTSHPYFWAPFILVGEGK